MITLGHYLVVSGMLFALGLAGVLGRAQASSALAFAASVPVSGRLLATAAALGDLKLKAVVRSPHTARRHGEMFGSITPNRSSRKRITEVWSKTCELTQPPRLHGEMMNMGTRGPRP